MNGSNGVSRAEAPPGEGRVPECSTRGPRRAAGRRRAGPAGVPRRGGFPTVEEKHIQGEPGRGVHQPPGRGARPDDGPRPATGRNSRRRTEDMIDSSGDKTTGKAESIVAGLGGLDNIIEIEGCITRLRTEVEDPSLIDETALKAAGAHGVVRMGTAVQVVIGTDADPIAAEIEDMM
ncbi:glucose PTS transporter subunit EIIB [Streptomyces desertarenae]|uniref:Glucose PTS transporter subunit EIIB n=1 Tax=Streptomyces desertarenae TaxID=2666184 RepID=A0ABW4PNI2_9ACTN